MAGPPRVLFVITGLDTGGAERMLAKLLSRLHRSAIEAEVVSLLGRGPVSDELLALGVPVKHLDVRRFANGLAAPFEVLKVVRRFAPKVIQGWMYHGNLTASMARACASHAPAVAWGIRQSLYSLAREKAATQAVIRLGAKLSGWPHAIIYNSETAKRQHEAIGYRDERACVIDNGFDLDRFGPDAQAYLEVRRELGVASETPLVGLIARFHPMKGHRIFVRAASAVAGTRKNVHFLLAGRGVEPSNPACASWFEEPNLKGRLHLLGERADVPRLTAALDVATSASSWGEAFPNVLGEAMSCGVPCVATDVGDARRILGEEGIIVAADEPEELARGWLAILGMTAEERRQLGIRARRRIRERFSLATVCDQYASLYAEMAH